MNETDGNIESRLEALRPRPISPDLENRIARGTSRPVPTRAARGFFWTTVAGGALAASTILVLLINQAFAPAPDANFVSRGASHDSSAFTVVAQADWRWGDDLNFDDHRRTP